MGEKERRLYTREGTKRRERDANKKNKEDREEKK